MLIEERTKYVVANNNKLIFTEKQDAIACAVAHILGLSYQQDGTVAAIRAKLSDDQTAIPQLIRLLTEFKDAS